MSQQLALEGFPVRVRDERGRYLATRISPEQPPPSTAEVATVERAEFLSGFTQSFPNFDPVQRHRAESEGLGLYERMLATDADLAGFFLNLNDDILHYETVVLPASDDSAHKEHARFFEFALKQVPHFQNAQRHFLDAHAKGFSVSEKIYKQIDRGEWAGAVIYADIIDKPPQWFNFMPDRSLRLRTAKNFLPGEPLDQEKFVVMTFGTNNSPWGEPVLSLAYWAWFLKHHALKNQGIWFERWASPTPVATYKWSGTGTTNEANRKKALEVAMSYQHDQAVAQPEGIAVSLLESARSGAISFESYIAQLTEMEARIVTGQVLASMAVTPGSYAQARVHAKQESNKVEMLASWLDAQINRQLGRELIDRNFGPQDLYPRRVTLARSPTERQAEATIEQMLLSNGHRLSASWSDKRFQVVAPADDKDALTLPPGIKPGQTLGVSPQLAEMLGISAEEVDRIWMGAALRSPATSESNEAISLAARSAIYEETKKKAETVLNKLEKTGADAAKRARPAIKRMANAIRSKIREKKSVKAITRASLYRGMRGKGAEMGKVFDDMMTGAGKIR